MATRRVLGLDGDFNDDGFVDATDYAVWRENLGTDADLPNDTTPPTVTSSDLTDWQNNYGAEAAAAATATPEPGTLGLVVLGFGLSAWRRR